MRQYSKLLSYLRENLRALKNPKRMILRNKRWLLKIQKGWLSEMRGCSKI